MRRSNVVDATVGDGVLVSGRRSKTNQDGETTDVRFGKLTIVWRGVSVSRPAGRGILARGSLPRTRHRTQAVAIYRSTIASSFIFSALRVASFSASLVKRFAISRCACWSNVPSGLTGTTTVKRRMFARDARNDRSKLSSSRRW